MVLLSIALSSQMMYFVAVALATPSPPINAAIIAQDAFSGSFCIDSCCPEKAIPKLIFGSDDRFGEGIVVMQNNSRLACMGEFEATNVRISGTNTTVADLISEVGALEKEIEELKMNNTVQVARVTDIQTNNDRLMAQMNYVLKTIPSPFACLDQYLKLGLSHLVLPHMHSVRAVSFWIFVEPVQGPYRWKYIMDARPGLERGWLAFLSDAGNLTHLTIGSSWQKLIVHSAGTGRSQIFGGINQPLTVPLNSSGLEWVGKWQHMYLEAAVSFEGEITVGARFAWGGSCSRNCSYLCGGNCRETLDASLPAFSLWDRALNDSEIENLAAGKGRISEEVGSGALLASYSASLAVSEPSRMFNNTAVGDATRLFAPGDLVTVWSSSSLDSANYTNIISSLESHPHASELPSCLELLRIAPLMHEVLKAEVASLTATVAMLETQMVRVLHMVTPPPTAPPPLPGLPLQCCTTWCPQGSGAFSAADGCTGCIGSCGTGCTASCSACGGCACTHYGTCNTVTNCDTSC